MARNERDRINRRLETVESFASRLRMMNGEKHFQRELAHAQAEIEHLEGRLRHLLGG